MMLKDHADSPPSKQNQPLPITKQRLKPSPPALRYMEKTDPARPTPSMMVIAFQPQPGMQLMPSLSPSTEPVSGHHSIMDTAWLQLRNLSTCC